MKKAYLVIGTLCLSLFLCVSSAFATGGDQTTSSTSVTQTNSNVTQSSQATSNGNGFEVKPMEPNRAAQGMNAMGKDLGTFGSGAAVPIGVIGLMVGGVMFLFGAIFSKNLLKSGLVVLLASFFWVFISSDFVGDINFLHGLGMKIRSYF